MRIMATFQNSYNSPYQPKISDMLTKIQNKTFEYDPLKDTGLQSAQEQAIGTVTQQAGRRNMLYSDSTKQGMGQAALNLVPQFRQQAQNEFNTRMNNLQNQLMSLQQLDAQNYGRHRDFVMDRRFQDGLEYSRSRDMINDARYTEEQRQQAKRWADEQYSRDLRLALDAAIQEAQITGDWNKYWRLLMDDQQQQQRQPQQQPQRDVRQPSPFVANPSQPVQPTQPAQPFLPPNFNATPAPSTPTPKPAPVKKQLTKRDYSAMGIAWWDLPQYQNNEPPD